MIKFFFLNIRFVKREREDEYTQWNDSKFYYTKISVLFSAYEVVLFTNIYF